MGNRRSERDMVEAVLLEHPDKKAHEIAEEVGLIEAMGCYDKAVAYVRRIKKTMRNNGQIKGSAYASEEDRLRDIEALFTMREGRMTERAAYHFLLLNCYYRLRSEDDKIHMTAIDDTYEKNNQLHTPFDMAEAVRICEIALSRYMQSKDKECNERARKRGLPGAGINYTNASLIEKLQVTEKELEHLISIKE